jgi:tripeptide aminopeptidase
MPDVSGYSFSVADRLIRYVQIDTQSDPQSLETPSTAKQFVLGALLAEEMKQLGLEDASMDNNGYVYATLPSNCSEDVPVVCFCAHMDTSPDCSGTGVKPLLHPHYDGSDIVLPDDPEQVIRMEEHPYLKERIGDTLITASGKTLLGADDKAGIAIIMDLLQFYSVNPTVPHGTLKILFTPDEEIGRGVDKADLSRIGAEAGYTLDGGERGSIEDENFSADAVTVIIHGVSAHPGSAKGKMVSALKVASFFVSSLPVDELSPESTEGRYGFVHPVSMEGDVEKASVEFILRDFNTDKLSAYTRYLQDQMEITLRRFPGARADWIVREQYRNMKEVLDRYPQVVEYAMRAIRRAGCTVKREGIRGGTDGARLSFMGLPCPNIFTGEMALHGKHEYVSVQDMQKSVETLLHLVEIWREESRSR